MEAQEGCDDNGMSIVSNIYNIERNVDFVTAEICSFDVTIPWIFVEMY